MSKIKGLRWSLDTVVNQWLTEPHRKPLRINSLLVNTEILSIINDLAPACVNACNAYIHGKIASKINGI